MATVRWSGIRLAGVWAVAPSAKGTVEDLAEKFGGADARKIAESTGVEERRLAPDGLCASDLCHEAGSRLLRELAWAPDSVDALVFVSQTADYALPATACGLQQRLGLAPSCAAFDVSLGCSGYVYGLWLAGALIQSRAARRVLLLAGDTMTRLVSPFDRATAPLFGDAGTATAIEGLPGGGPSWTFVLGTDGAGQAHLIVPAGRFRQASSEATRNRTEREGGNRRSDEDLFMDGAEVFAFTLREVPPLVASVLAGIGEDRRGHRLRRIPPGEPVHAALPGEEDRPAERESRPRPEAVREHDLRLDSSGHGDRTGRAAHVRASHALVGRFRRGVVVGCRSG